MERVYGEFKRTINLPWDIEANQVEAAYENGVLEITLPKAVKERPKQIEIAVK